MLYGQMKCYLHDLDSRRVNVLSLLTYVGQIQYTCVIVGCYC